LKRANTHSSIFGHDSFDEGKTNTHRESLTYHSQEPYFRLDFVFWSFFEWPKHSSRCGERAVSLELKLIIMILLHHHQLEPIEGNVQQQQNEDRQNDRVNLNNNINREKNCCEKFFLIVLIEVAANDHWMLLYCLGLTILEGWTFPLIAGNLFRYIPPPSDNYAAFLGYAYAATLGLFIGALGILIGLTVGMFPVISILRCIYLYRGRPSLENINRHQEPLPHQQPQSSLIRILRFLVFLPHQCLVLWISYKHHGMLATMLTEFTRPKLYHDFLRNLMMCTAFVVVTPLAVGYAVFTFRRLAPHIPAVQRWIRARLPIV
jgi:hypothetical protein